MLKWHFVLIPPISSAA